MKTIESKIDALSVQIAELDARVGRRGLELLRFEDLNAFAWFLYDQCECISARRYAQHVSIRATYNHCEDALQVATYCYHSCEMDCRVWIHEGQVHVEIDAEVLPGEKICQIVDVTVNDDRS